MVIIKSAQQIAGIKEAAAIWVKVKGEIEQFVTEGKSLIEIDQFAKSLEKKYNFSYTFYKYHGFPNNICISVNEVIIHGVATGYILKSEDLVTFDIGITYNKYVCDAAFSMIIGKSTAQTEKINRVCYESLMKGIMMIAPNNHVGDISYAIQEHATSNGFKVIKDFGGHGCGVKLHEDPMILNYGKPGSGPKLLPGMVLCIEPMLLTDDESYFIDSKDKWSVIAKNRKLTCHWEHMVLVTETGHEILTI